MTLETALISGISGLGGCVIWLALYLRKVNNDRIKDAKEIREVLLKVVEKNTDAFHSMKSSIELNTVATTNGAEQMRGATDRLTTAVNELGRNERK